MGRRKPPDERTGLGVVETDIVKVDWKRQRKHFRNIRHNSVARTSMRKPIWRKVS